MAEQERPNRYVPSSWAEFDAAQGLAAYVAENGVRNEQVRLGYLAEVHGLDGYDNAGRSAAKEAWRRPTPAPQRALIKADRPDTGPGAGSSGNANKTNPAATRTARTWGMIGRGNALLAAALGAYEVAKSENKPRAAAGVAGSTAGGVAGGIAGAEVGALIGTPFIPPFGTAVGAVVGGLAGAIGGGIGGDWAGETAFDMTNRHINRSSAPPADK